MTGDIDRPAPERRVPEPTPAAVTRGGPRVALADGTEGFRTVLRRARPADARAIAEIVRPYADKHILIGKDLITYFEDIQEFTVAEGSGSHQTGATGELIGCGALHVMWDDIAEVRTLAVRQEYRRRGVGQAVLTELLERARSLGLSRVFCLTFEVAFFSANGFREIEGTPVGTDTYYEMLRSHDDGIAEFLDLARVKPNTLGNTRMLLDL
ncbi:MAG: amino-acid N-acetyltransferase [Actinomyces sp.]|uniref:amino-acid N-acetyltransferase n=1 Tax=Actinomyces sp. TaxID=29317 RepID=UPI0026DB4F51|nr:amino-acid N-acetyltransferase [Actinomyces sp.]MDO4244263.1 amino-acid N-acetyltransferase [Actinomyces sp.]